LGPPQVQNPLGAFVFGRSFRHSLQNNKKTLYVDFMSVLLPVTWYQRLYRWTNFLEKIYMGIIILYISIFTFLDSRREENF
jgi:hypothetical protein